LLRRELLRAVGIDIAGLGNLDLIDAALCAYTADALLRGAFRHYGDSVEGLIVVPA
jgi:hypothetical protein